MRQCTTLTSMTQFALQVVPREDEDERQKEQPHELFKKAQRHALRLFCAQHVCSPTHPSMCVQKEQPHELFKKAQRHGMGRHRRSTERRPPRPR